MAAVARGEETIPELGPISRPTLAPFLTHTGGKFVWEIPGDPTRGLSGRVQTHFEVSSCTIEEHTGGSDGDHLHK